MIAHVCERAAASGAGTVCVATDDERILRAVEQWGFRAVMTRGTHPSGTDRIAEAAGALGLAPDEIVVNVQGDEPLIEPGLIREVAATLERNPEASVSTACHAISDPAQLANPNVVKAVLDRRGFAMYFSRSQIPYPREAGGTWLRHAGIYGYRVEFLRLFPTLPQSPLERTESLEQLRVLWHGYRIAVTLRAGEPAPSVDAPGDVELVLNKLGDRQ
jgi:3-deoxy-manno-octulosonate cytidylyltransferase (CMP-KDO synthetase)